jgi:hypothetical protein
MAFILSQSDRERLDDMLDFFLGSCAKGEVSIASARSALAQILTAAVIDNEGEVLAWLRPEQLVQWKEDNHADWS